jgi:hypothetical protein
MILGNNDWYYCLRRDSYNFKGIKIEERLKEAKRIDDEEGNILLGK